MILTCEINNKEESVEIIFDFQGLEYLKKVINSLNLNNIDKTDHIHLMTKEWGGNELTSETMHVGNSLVNHLKIVMINPPKS